MYIVELIRLDDGHQVKLYSTWENTEHVHAMSEQRKAHQNNCLSTEKYTLYFENVFGYVSNLSSKN